MGKLYILDNGHGVETPGKRSPIHDGMQLMEYEFNRDIVNRVATLLQWAGIEYRVLVPETSDISLMERVRRANAWGDRDSILISIHANAGGGRGYEVYTSPGETKADPIATTFLQSYSLVFPEAPPRLDISDGDTDKEEDFYILTKTSMPAILTESFFMDKKSDCTRYLMKDEGRNLIALTHYMAIMQIETGG